jgi:hypothetical protein
MEFFTIWVFASQEALCSMDLNFWKEEKNKKESVGLTLYFACISWVYSHYDIINKFLDINSFPMSPNIDMC